MTLVQKYALLPDEIDRQSLVMVADSLAGNKVLNQLDEQERYVLHRIVRAEGDPAIADDVRFSGNAVANGIGLAATNPPGCYRRAGWFRWAYPDPG